MHLTKISIYTSSICFMNTTYTRLLQNLLMFMQKLLICPCITLITEPSNVAIPSLSDYHIITLAHDVKTSKSKQHKYNRIKEIFKIKIILKSKIQVFTARMANTPLPHTKRKQCSKTWDVYKATLNAAITDSVPRETIQIRNEEQSLWLNKYHTIDQIYKLEIHTTCTNICSTTTTVRKPQESQKELFAA